MHVLFQRGRAAVRRPLGKDGAFQDRIASRAVGACGSWELLQQLGGYTVPGHVVLECDGVLWEEILLEAERSILLIAVVVHALTHCGA